LSYINFCIWKSISEIGKPDDKDVLLYEQLVTRPVYTDSINHFTYIFFDTVLALPQGSFYAGWRQNQPFILNVGYDNNYRWADENTGNPNLFNNLLGSWERSDYDIKGVPMIRPLSSGIKTYGSFGISLTLTPFLSSQYFFLTNSPSSKSLGVFMISVPVIVT
jgi:hypothetical protein